MDGTTAPSTLVATEVNMAVSFYSGGNDYTSAIAGGKTLLAGCISGIIDNANSKPCEDKSNLIGENNDE
jgi:hypothetical protein